MGLFDVKKKGLGFLSTTAPMCRACSRTKNPIFVSGRGEHEILVVIDEPSESESFSHKAFIGDKYDEIRDILSKKGLSFENDCWKIHAAACFDEEEKTLEKAVSCCNPHFLDTVKSLKPKVIIALGGASTKALLGKRFSDASVGRWRGFPIFHPELECWMVSTYDPSWSNDARTYDAYAMIIEQDISLALSLLEKKAPKKLNPKIITCTDFNDVCFELELLLERAEEVALDYETTGLKPSNKGHRIAANSFTYSYKGGDKIRTISYPISYRNHFTKNQRRKVKELTREILLSEIPKIGHHSKFEDVWGNVILGCKTNNWIWCTMYTAHLLDERPNHISLKTQAFIHFQAEPYEEKTKKYLQAPDGSGANAFNSVDKCPLLDLLHYNGLDTYYTYLLYRKQKKIIQKNPSLFPVAKLFLEGALCFSSMEQTGFGVVPGYFEEKDKEIALQIKEKKRAILDTKEARKFNKIMKVPFSFSKDSHIDSMIYRVMKTEQFKVTKKGKRAKDNEVLAALEKQGSVWAKEYSEYARLRKAKDTFVAQFLLEKNELCRVNTLYNLAATRTGRPSGCVAKGTMIEVVRDLSKNPLGIPIEQVKEGDYVYCFDKNRNPVLRKVLWAGKTGTKEVVEVHWKAMGSKRTGVLKVTPEHKIRTISGKYVEACKILKKDHRDLSISGNRSPRHRVLAMSRKIDKLDRVYFSGKNTEPVIDHRFVYKKLIGPLKKEELIHHKDFNHFNNLPDNLLKISHSCHSSLHQEFRSEETVEKQRIGLEKARKAPKVILRGEKHHGWKKMSAQRILRDIFSAKGEYSKTGTDFSVFLRKCSLVGIDPKKIKRRFSKNIGYITRGFLIRNAHKNRNQLAKEIGCGHYRIDQLYDERSIKYSWREDRVTNNHIIKKVVYTGEITDVYDLCIEGCHNFIANEICVHNSSPNLLNIPKRNKFIMNLIRGGIKAPIDGHKFCEADYGSLEVRVAACYTKDPVLIRYIMDPTSDMHRDSATDLFFMPPEKVSKMARFFAKNGFVFANFYGSSAKSAARNLWKILPEVFDTDNVPVFSYLEDNDIYDYTDFEEHIIAIQKAFWEKFKVFKQWQLDMVQSYYDNGYIESKHGFRRRGVLGYNEIINTPIQGSAFFFLLWSCIQVDNIAKKEKWESRVMGQIYDSMLSSICPDEEKHVTQTIRYVMEEKVREQFPWICVPMVAEFEITEPNGTWNTLKELKVEYDKKFRKW